MAAKFWMYFSSIMVSNNEWAKKLFLVCLLVLTLLAAQ
jgi:hypothetical protein